MFGCEGLPSGSSEVLVQYERQLSTGLIGSIWLGRLASGEETGRLVTVRRIPMALLSADDVERIRLGAWAGARLRSPSIVKLLGVAEMDQELICISEYLAGVRLIDLERCLIQSETVAPVSVAVRLILEVARAAISARRLMTNIGVLSPLRVVCSDNALIALFGEVLLTDVGIMSNLLRSSGVTRLPAVMADLSPEELSPTGAAPGSSEVFTLGVALWQLLTNRWVKLAHSAIRMPSDSAEMRSIPPVNTVERMGLPVPEPVARLLRQATHRDAHKRFTSLETLVDAIEQLPAHCIATSRQFQSFIQQVAPQVLPECDTSATWSVQPRMLPGRSPSSRPTAPRITYDFDPPTFAERRLVAPVGSSVPSPSTEIILATPRISGVLAMETDLASVVPIESRRNASSRKRLALALAAATFVLAISGLIILQLNAPPRSSQHRANSASSLPQHAPESPGALTSVHATDSVAVANQHGADRHDQTAEHEATPESKDRSNTEAATTNPASASSSRPHKIAPYRPRGI